MPRSGWIATGAVIAAIVSAHATHQALAAVVLAGSALLFITWAARRVRLGRYPRADALSAACSKAALLTLGTLFVAGRALVTTPLEALVPGALPMGDGPWTATVVSIGAPRAGQQPAVMAFESPAGIRVAGTLPVFPVVVPGDRVSVRGTLRAPPTDDPYGAYLERIDVQGTIRVTHLDLEPQPGDLARALEGLRRGADRALRLAVPEPEAGLASGILIGLRDRVDRDLSAAFTAVGATHVVAISGWNIAIVATTLAAFAGRLARRRRALLTAVAIVGYVTFVGPSASVVRAAGMAGVVMLARELGRPSRAAAAIGWAVVALLVSDPGLVADAGFQLSALATVGLIMWGTPFTDRLAGRSPGRPRAWLAESLGVSLAAQLATLPIVVLSFGRLSLVSPIVNLGVVPLVAPAMGAGVAALGGGLLAMSGTAQALATIAGLPAWLLLSLMVGVVRSGASLPFASVQLDDPWNVAVAAAAGLGIAVATVATRRASRIRRSTGEHPRADGAVAAKAADRVPSWRRTRAGRVLAVGLAASMVSLAVVVVQQPDGVPRITVLDVGQGDAILVEGGHGGRLLIDGGPDPGRLLVALDEHLPPWDRRVDLVILSHPHEDHAAGLAALLDRYAVARVLEPGMFGPGPGYAALNAELIALGIARGTLSAGDRLSVDEFHFRVLWPDPGSVPEQPPDTGTGINNVSIVLLGDVDGHRVLLAGDIEEQIDPKLLAHGLPQVEFLKVAHHGSRTASTEAFLAAVQPAVAAISVGRDNPYGHPAPDTVARLEAAGARVLRTDTEGNVTVDLGMGPLHVRTTGARTAMATVAAGGTSVAPAATTQPGWQASQLLRAQTGSSSSLIGSPAARVQSYLCAIPLPPLGIVALRAPAPSTASRTRATATPASRALASSPPIVAARPTRATARASSSDFLRSLGYDAARDPRSPGNHGPAAAADTATLLPDERLIRFLQGRGAGRRVALPRSRRRRGRRR